MLLKPYYYCVISMIRNNFIHYYIIHIAHMQPLNIMSTDIYAIYPDI